MNRAVPYLYLNMSTTRSVSKLSVINTISVEETRHSIKAFSFLGRTTSRENFLLFSGSSVILYYSFSAPSKSVIDSLLLQVTTNRYRISLEFHGISVNALKHNFIVYTATRGGKSSYCRRQRNTVNNQKVFEWKQLHCLSSYSHCATLSLHSEVTECFPPHCSYSYRSRTSNCKLVTSNIVGFFSIILTGVMQNALKMHTSWTIGRMVSLPANTMSAKSDNYQEEAIKYGADVHDESFKPTDLHRCFNRLYTETLQWRRRLLLTVKFHEYVLQLHRQPSSVRLWRHRASSQSVRNVWTNWARNQRDSQI